jgi:hypothetical protein
MPLDGIEMLVATSGEARVVLRPFWILVDSQPDHLPCVGPLVCGPQGRLERLTDTASSSWPEIEISTPPLADTDAETGTDMPVVVSTLVPVRLIVVCLVEASHRPAASPIPSHTRQQRPDLRAARLCICAFPPTCGGSLNRPGSAGG